MPEEIKSPRVFRALNQRLNELNMTRSDFIRKFHKDHGDDSVAKNHMFKVLNGGVIIGEKTLVEPIAETLNIDKRDLLQLVRADKIDNKEWASAIPKASPLTQEVAVIMEGMSTKMRGEILQYTKMKAGLL